VTDTAQVTQTATAMTAPKMSDGWHRQTEWEAAVSYEQGHQAGYTGGYAAGMIAALTPDEKQAAGYRGAKVAERLAEMAAGLDGLNRRCPASPGWPRRGEFVGGWLLPPTYADPEAPPMLCSRDGWPVPPTLWPRTTT
jgi:hypothetical protein